jgi:cell wall-associated NlpC family hydrolase
MRALAAWMLMTMALVASGCASTGAVPRPFPGAKTYGAPRAGAPDKAPVAAPADAEPGLAPLDTDSVVGTALALRGIPYRNGGSNPNGFDCSGFTQYVFAQHGIELSRGVRDQFKQGRTVESSELAAGDLVFFSTTDPGVSHVAIMIGGDEFVHAPSSTGVVRIERLSSSYWSRRYLGARRMTAQTEQ